MKYNQSPRICIVTPSQPKYSETFIQNHIDLFPKSTLVITGEHFPLFDAKGLQLLKISKIVYYIDKLLQKTFGINKSMLYPYFLALYLKLNGITHLLCEYGPTGVSLLKTATIANVQIVTHFHGYDAHVTTLLSAYQQSYLELFKHCKKIIAVSNVMRFNLIALGCEAEKICLLRYGVEDRFFATVQTDLASNYFVAVGRFVDKKAPYLTILAFDIFLRKFPKYSLKMVGDGVLLDTCVQLAKALNIENKIEFCGVRRSDEVLELLTNSVGFIQHSILTLNKDSEGTPVAIIEAMAVGLPIVSTFHAGIREIVEDNVTGFLVEEGDIVGMAEKLGRIASNPIEASRIGKNAKQYAMGNFRISQQIDALVSTIIN